MLFVEMGTVGVQLEPASLGRLRVVEALQKALFVADDAKEFLRVGEGVYGCGLFVYEDVGFAGVVLSVGYRACEGEDTVDVDILSKACFAS